MLDAAGYDISARERKALRHYLNNDYNARDLRRLPDIQILESLM